MPILNRPLSLRVMLIDKINQNIPIPLYQLITILRPMLQLFIPVPLDSHQEGSHLVLVMLLQLSFSLLDVLSHLPQLLILLL